MRKRLLGTIAAVTTGAGASLGQSPAPPPPMPIGAVGGMPAPLGVIQANGVYADPIPSPVGQPPALSGALPFHTGDPSYAGFGDPGMGGFPGYPAGVHADQHWHSPSGVAEFDRTIAPKFWLNTNYLLWFAKSQPANFPFVTTSAPNDGGQLGRPTTTILHSTTDLGYNVFSGFKLEGGLFCDDCRRHGIYAAGFLTEQKANTFYAASDSTGQPLLARPFLNLGTGQPDVLLVSFPTFASGSVLVYTRSQAWGADGGPIFNIYRTDPSCNTHLFSLNGLVAFRYFELDENLEIAQRTTLLNGFTAPFDGKQYSAPASIEVRDQFTAINQFYGGQVGFTLDARKGRWSTNIIGKFAMGLMHQRVNIQGSSALSDPTRELSSVVVGGLYANATNVGSFVNDEFAIMPEVSANLAYNWTSWFSTSIGYNFLYVNRVARPGDQYSAAVNPAVVPTSPTYGFGGAIAGPNPLFTQTDYWIQGVNFGFTIRY